MGRCGDWTYLVSGMWLREHGGQLERLLWAHDAPAYVVRAVQLLLRGGGTWSLSSPSAVCRCVLGVRGRLGSVG